MPHNYAIALLITFLAGLATAIGSVFAFVLKKDNLKALSVGLGFSAGVMIFLSFNDIIPEAGELLAVNYQNSNECMVLFSLVAGNDVAIFIDYFLPDHVYPEELENPEGPCNKRHKIKKEPEKP